MKKLLNLNNCFILLLVSNILFLMEPVYLDVESRRFVTGLLFTLIIISFLSLVINTKWEFIFGLVLAVPGLIHNGMMVFGGSTQPTFLLLVCNTLFYCFVVVELLRFILKTDKVDFNIISAAISVYLIIGLIWTFIYAALDLRNPGAILSSSAENYYEVLQDYLYFSFVTMTTLGYGDISPSTTVAQRWVILQAIVGQFYLVIFVARLVGLYSRQK